MCGFFFGARILSARAALAGYCPELDRAEFSGQLRPLLFRCALVEIPVSRLKMLRCTLFRQAVAGDSFYGIAFVRVPATKPFVDYSLVRLKANALVIGALGGNPHVRHSTCRGSIRICRSAGVSHRAIHRNRLEQGCNCRGA